MEKPKILVIVGPTGSGKTSLSIELAQHYNGEVINADSRQVYKELDIGTEKIAEEDMHGVVHHLLSILSPNEVYTAKQFVQDAQHAIGEIVASGNTPIVTGGTFFYIDMLLRKVQGAPVPPNPELRETLEAHDAETLFAMLQEKDPLFAARIDKHNKRRLLRALEIVHVLPSIPETQAEEPPFDALVLGLLVDKKMLRASLRTRAEGALKRGLIDETKRLLEEDVTHERLSEIGLEYRLVLEHLEGNLDRTALIQKLEEKNWQYAKRQLVWLKRDPSIVWVDPSNREAIHQKVREFLQLT